MLYPKQYNDNVVWGYNMASFEQKTMEQGSTMLKLIKVKETIAGSTRVFGTMLLTMRHLREQDSEMMIVRIIPLSGITVTSGANIKTVTAAEKLSINKFSIFINHRNEIIEFGPEEGVSIEENLRSKGVGSFALTELITFAKGHFPDYSVNSYEILPIDGLSTEDKDRRNKFLENFGFQLTFADITNNSGTMKARKVSSLKTYVNNDKIDELEIEPYFLGLIVERSKLEREFQELKNDYSLRGEELLGGIPKQDIIKYTLMSFAVILVIFIFLMMM